MTSTAELTAPPRFEWKRWPETDEFLDEADRPRPLRATRWPPRLAEPDARRDRHAIQGMGRPPGIEGRSAACRADWLCWVTNARARLMPSACRCSPTAAGFFRRSHLSAARPRGADGEGLRCARRLRSRSSRSPRFRGHTTWGLRSPGTRWDHSEWRRIGRRTDDPGRGGAEGVQRIRALSR